MTRPAELASFNVAHSDDALGCIMHSPAARALLLPHTLLHHPHDTLNVITLLLAQQWTNQIA